MLVRFFILMAFPLSVFGASVSLPNSQQTYNYDEIRTSSGTTCRQAMGSNLTAEVGVIDADSFDRNHYSEIDKSFRKKDSDAAIYARIVYQIGAPKRIDCSQLYAIEIENLKAELEMLRRSQMFSMGGGAQ